MNVFVSGTFAILHPGHLRLLRFAKECGAHLSVAVLSDRLADPGTHMSESLRLESLRSISWVDEAFILDESVTQWIMRSRPDVVVKGKEHESRFNPELEALDNY